MRNTDIEAYDVASFCRAYGVSRSFVYLEIKAGRLLPFKAGRRTLISRQAADCWRRELENQTRLARENRAAMRAPRERAS